MVKKRVNKNWFKKNTLNSKAKWGFVPVNWKGWVTLLLLVGVNVFAGNYFNLNVFNLDSWLKMGTVFFLSVLVFILVARRKTLK